MAMVAHPLTAANFQAFEGSTIVSRRNFGLLRGNSLKNALSLLQLANLDEDQKKEPIATTQISPPTSTKKKPKATFGQGGFGDKSCNIWDWPLGKVTVTNTETVFQASVDFKPFRKDEISAKIMGHELIIHCRTDDSRPRPRREFYRTYQLPLNLDTASVRFTIKDSSRLIICGQKHQPLKLAIAFFTPDDAG